MTISLGTRGSQLALAQTELVKQAVERIPDHPEVAIAVIKTQGDQRMDLKLSESGETFDKRSSLKSWKKRCSAGTPVSSPRSV